MKQLSGKIKIVLIISILIIIVGIVMLFTKGVNKELLYSDNTKIELSKENLNIEDITNAASDSFGKEKIKVQTVGDYEDEIVISVLDMQDEALDNFQNKLKEINQDEDVKTTLTQVGKVHFVSLIKPYIKPIIITTLIIIIYAAIRYRKFGIVKQVVYPILSVGIVELVYISLIAIFRLPVGIYTMPIATFIYIITMIIVIQNNHKNIIEE